MPDEANKVSHEMKMDASEMQKSARQASALLAAMANEKRLMILCQLVDGEKSVNELADELEIRQSTVSQHLALLRKEGFIAPRREGQSQIYSLAADEPRAVLETLYSLYCEPPDGAGVASARGRRTAGGNR